MDKTALLNCRMELKELCWLWIKTEHCKIETLLATSIVPHYFILRMLIAKGSCQGQTCVNLKQKQLDRKTAEEEVRIEERVIESWWPDWGRDRVSILHMVCNPCWKKSPKIHVEAESLTALVSGSQSYRKETDCWALPWLVWCCCSVFQALTQCMPHFPCILLLLPSWKMSPPGGCGMISTEFRSLWGMQRQEESRMVIEGVSAAERG